MLNTRTELGTLEVLNPLSSNVDKYTVFVLDTGDITPGYIGEVSILYVLFHYSKILILMRFFL
jgi:hypothetical protein